ncbi:MAG: 2Fe-2S iron-sulfur cluster-binding protein [Deferribacterales bacterium]
MFFTSKYKITIVNKNIVLEVKHGSNLYKVLREHDLIDKMLCDGSSQCGKCKVKITGPDVNKPTKKERLVLAETSLDSGIRLACQYSVKSDIKVDTQEPTKRENVNPGIISMKIVKKSGEVEENEFKPFLHSDMFISQSEASVKEPVKVPENYEPELIVDETVLDDVPEERVSHETFAFTPPIEEEIQGESAKHQEETIKIVSHINGNMVQDDSYSNDGLLLIQLPDGIQYYHYSAGIGNIASKGTIKTSERLETLLEKQFVSDFIYNNINIKDIERVIIMLDDCYFEGKEMFNLVIYTSIHIGSFLIEVLQPMQNHRDMVRFMRFVNQTPGKRLLIPLDSMEKAYFLDEGNLFELESSNTGYDGLLTLSEFNGKNPVIGLSDDLLETSIKDNFHQPDSISFTVFFHTAVIFMKTGLTDKRLQLRERSDVMDLMPLEITVKLGKHDGLKRFNIYRKQGCDLYIDQNALNSLNRFRLFIRSVIGYAEKRFNTIDNIVFYTLTDSMTLAEDLLALSAVPKKYEKRLKTFSGDPAIYAVQFFQEKDVEVYFSKRFGTHEVINLDEDAEFIDMQKECEQKIIS